MFEKNEWVTQPPLAPLHHPVPMAAHPFLCLPSQSPGVGSPELRSTGSQDAVMSMILGASLGLHHQPVESSGERDTKSSPDLWEMGHWPGAELSQSMSFLPSQTFPCMIRSCHKQFVMPAPFVPPAFLCDPAWVQPVVGSFQQKKKKARVEHGLELSLIPGLQSWEFCLETRSG